MPNTKAVGVAFADPAFDSVQVGSAGAPIQITSSGILNGSYATTSATSGDTRLTYQRLAFTSTGSGETIRAFSTVTGVNAATAGTINGAHIAYEPDGSWRIVVSDTDPGHPNWVSTAGRSSGLIWLRWFLPEETPHRPVCRVVKVDEVRR